MQVDYIDHFGDDRMVVNAARVSFNKWIGEDTELLKKDKKLINYLAKNMHRSPFYQPKVQLRVHVPFFIANQLKRHQVGFDLNEVSRRYVDEEPEIYYPSEWRGRPEGSIKQGSGDQKIELIALKDKTHDMYWKLEPESVYKTAMSSILEIYNAMIAGGIAPEQARLVLPQSAYTTFLWTGSLYGWANLCWQRVDSHAQLEIQQMAQSINDIIEPLFPVSWAALMKYKPTINSEG